MNEATSRLEDGGPEITNLFGSPVRLVRSFVVVLWTGLGNPPTARPWLQNLPDWHPIYFKSDDRKSEIAFAVAQMTRAHEPLPATRRLTLVVGDDSEWDDTQGDSCMANAACVEWDPARSELRILSSIVGLPPLFIYRKSGMIVVASELHLLRAVTGLRVNVSPRAAVELFTVGYPIEHRTLFEDITLMPGGHSLRVDTRGRFDFTQSWDASELRPADGRTTYIDFQADAFRQAVRKLELADSVFSLTGGLDTRTILAVISESAIKLPACTISGGRTRCLDARLAEALCIAYGLPHLVIALDDRFLRDLPTYVIQASLLSGGVASVEQAHEVYFYRQLQRVGSKRLSGYLGNQVGRGGVEGISLRNADLHVLNDTIQAVAPNELSEHWLASATAFPGHSLFRMLIQREVPFSSVGNYSIGQHFMIQQSPYASRHLIEISCALNDSHSSGEFVAGQARLRDLRHRFFGQLRSRSFQRKVIEAVGGAAATYPINWGWRARGGVSLQGLGWGMLAFADAASSRPRVPFKLVRQILRFMRLDGLHEITQYPGWFDTALREFVNDTLRSRLVRESELFNAATVVRLLDEHYHGKRSHYKTLLATVDLALAQQLFVARL